MLEPEQMQPDSWVVTGGRPHEPGAPLNVPIVPASNFAYGMPRTYAREHPTPTVEAFEELVGGLEGGTAVAFASGMGAALAVLMSTPPSADVVLAEGCYQGVKGLARGGERKGRWRVRTIDPADTEAMARAAGEADLLWLESVSNPLLAVAELPAICAAPRKPECVIVVDNTLPTSFGCRPLEVGADLVVHSASKFLGGHSDLLAGVVVAADSGLANEIQNLRMVGGAVMGALEAYLAARGVRTLALRMERSQSNAATLAERLDAHDEVDVVRFPGLPSHGTHEVAKRVLHGYGAMISFDVTGDAARADAVCTSLQIVRHTTSLGGVESTIERRAAVPGQGHLPPTLLRLSVGCENVEDIWKDLDRALHAARAPGE